MNTVKQDFYRISRKAMDEMGRLLKEEPEGTLCWTIRL